MTSAELLLTFVVALVVFGPKKLPMLAAHLAKLFRFIETVKNQAAQHWQKFLAEQQLQENLEKAKQIDLKDETPGKDWQNPLEKKYD